MTIELIQELMAVPKFPVETDGHNWPMVETELGVTFPDDYKDFLAIYGTGVIGNFLWVLNPFSRNPNLNSEKILYFRDAYQSMKKQFPDEYPRDTSSFLPWAVTDNGDSFLWLINDTDPNKWLVAVHSNDQGEEEISSFKNVDFLAVLLDGRLVSSILPEEFLRADKGFTPISPSAL